jgi:hypothetical protein
VCCCLGRLWESTVQYLCHSSPTISAHYWVVFFHFVSAGTMGRSRKAVPAALHTELSEYASLLRALRTSDTLDLSSQLAKAQPRTSTSAHEVDTENAEDGIIPASRNTTPNDILSSKSKGSPATQGPSKKTNWTRWPLLEGDVHTPEFGFEDEIATIASEALKLQHQADTESDNGPPEDDDEEAYLPQSFLDSLTLASSTHLSQILSMLAAHIPLAETSMQNRIKPMGWEDVLDIVAVSGLIHPKSVFDRCTTWL